MPLPLAQQSEINRAAQRRALVHTIKLRPGITTQRLLQIADPFGSCRWSDHAIVLRHLSRLGIIRSVHPDFPTHPNAEWFVSSAELCERLLRWAFISTGPSWGQKWG